MDNSETDIDLIVGSDVGITVLMFACSNGHENVAQLLMVNSERNRLHSYACRNGHKDVVKFLVCIKLLRSKLELNITYSGHFLQSPTEGTDPHLQEKT